MQALEQEIKELIIAALSLEDVKPQDIETEAPLFVEGLGLDSIDALEIALMIQQHYGVELRSEDPQTRPAFASLRALTTHILQRQSA